MAKKDENEKTQQDQKEDGSMRNEGLPLANDVHLQNPNNAPLLADQQEARAPGQAHQGAPDPPTEGKKQRSRLNAVKHGIFCHVVLLGRESKHEYQTLVSELFEAHQPVGRLEEVLVEKLASLLWRSRRVLQSEGAEILSAMHSAYYGADEEEKIVNAVVQSRKRGLILSAIRNRALPSLIDAVQELRELRREIEKNGLNWERDQQRLRELYGTETEYRLNVNPWTHKPEVIRIDPEPNGFLAERYRALTLSNRNNSDQGPSQDPRTDSIKFVIGILEKDIRRFEGIIRRWHTHKSRSSQCAFVAAVVPSLEVGERLLRYEAMLDKSIDRTLSQLERLQRMRLGQPVPPVKVELSS